MAPLRIVKGLSWVVGWISEMQPSVFLIFLCHRANVLASHFRVDRRCSKCPLSIRYNDPGLVSLELRQLCVPEVAWHIDILAILVISAIVNIQGSRVLPVVENLSLGFHVVAFIIVFVVICVVSPTKHVPEFVFVDTINNSGWGNNGIAWCVAIHLCEEMKDPRTDIPLAMVGAVLINGTMGFGFLVAILFCMGDLKSALDTTTGYPIIEIFYNITGNSRSATALCSTIVIMAGLASIPLLTSASRMVWVLARDKGKHDTWPRRDSFLTVYATSITCYYLVIENG
ncbi:unnamed protein product [Aspergillus oryzae]|nr:unnamed protein product [Aspergillus oryzae]